MKVLLASNGIPPGSPTVGKSFRSMAKELRVDQGTVRSRMRRFHEQRILRGWYLGVSPAVTGHGVVHAWFEFEALHDKPELIDELLSMPSVERACDYLGPRASVVLFYRNERDLDVSLDRIAKLVRPAKLFHARGTFPVGHPALTESDLAIIGNLQEDPWKPYSVVAKEVGMSPKTVKRRVTMLAEAGAICALPDVDLRAIRGFIPAELVVSYVPKERKAEVNQKIISHIGEHLVFSQVSESHGYFALMVPNVSIVEAIEIRVRQLNFVSEVHTAVLQDVVLNANHYKSMQRAVRREAQIAQGQKVSTIAR